MGGEGLRAEEKGERRGEMYQRIRLPVYEVNTV